MGRKITPAQIATVAIPVAAAAVLIKISTPTASAPDFPAQVLEDGSVRISPQQAKLHQTTEGIALVVAAPVSLWIATRKRKLTLVEKMVLGVLAVGTLAVDGHLYGRYSDAGPADG